MGGKLRLRWQTWRRLFSRLWLRLLAFNLLLVFLPVIGFLTLESYENNLLIWQERSMVQQGRLLAAALGADPAATLPGSAPTAVDGEQAQRILRTMNRHFDARLRVIDLNYRVLADSADLVAPPLPDPTLDPPPASYDDRTSPSADPEVADEDPRDNPRDNPIYRLGNLLYRTYARVFLPPDPVIGRTMEAIDGRLELPEVGVALRGSYGSATRRSGTKRSLTLSSALPIRHNGQGPVLGVVLVSKSTFQILSTLYQVRLETFSVVLWSLFAATLLSLFLAGTIARPISQLVQRATQLLDRRGRLRGVFEASKRHDEIGDLSRALAELTRRLEGHLRFIESFAADVSHELKNPLASIRNAGNLLLELEQEALAHGDSAESQATRRRFLEMILQDSARLERLIRGIREVSRLDADLEALPIEDVPLKSLLRQVADGWRARGLEHELILDLPPGEIWVAASADRLVQVLGNLMDNARSFAPIGTKIQVQLRAEGRDAVVQVADEGPGIPPEHLDKVFDRFFSYRPDHSPSLGHTGLGLAIVKAIVEGYGGHLRAMNRPGGGSLFEFRLVQRARGEAESPWVIVEP